MKFMRPHVNGRRKVALEHLEKRLKEWNKHSKDKMDGNRLIRTHEAEKARIEKEIETLKTRIK